MTMTQMPSLSDFDLHLLAEGTHHRSYEKLGAHVVEENGRKSTHFAVWAPHARAVSVIGDFNGWNPEANPLNPHWPAGVWEGVVPYVGSGASYKYSILPPHRDDRLAKADPFAFHAETPPRNASKVWDLGGYEWHDEPWRENRAGINSLGAPITIYEVHLGSWMRVPEEGNRWLSYRELAPKLADYVHEMGYTHVELMPISEYPFDGSWGYQPVSLFAPTSRFGTPQDFMYLIDTLHQRGIGVILDWVPAHFPNDDHGLRHFDGTPLYEYADPRKGFHQEWNTLIYDYNKPQVRNFLLSNALYWLDLYHVDALRVDAVSSMLYLDFARKPGEWVPNRYGGRENLEAVTFLRQFNEVVHADHPDVLTIAEETTSWPMVSRPTDVGGLGFNLKWDLGWVHDTVDDYLRTDPWNRSQKHQKLTFRMVYAFNENFILPLSHDEVKPPMGALPVKMPGDDWQKFANVRLLFGYQFALPGKKLMFMGDEFGQWREWDHDQPIDWSLLEHARHQGLRRWVRDLNTAYRGIPALHERDCQPEGFDWVDCNDVEASVLSLLRRGHRSDDPVLIACNFMPTPRYNYRLGVPFGGTWEEILNSDAPLYGGSGQGNMGTLKAAPVHAHGHSNSLNLTLPPLAMVAFRRRKQ